MVAETKLTRPRLPRRLVEADTRLERLDGAEEVPFTLVSAPAGFGKTTLVSHWLEVRKPVHAWLTIDTRDNTPYLFWRSVSAALARVDPGFDLRESTLLAALEPGAAVDPVALLVNRLSTYARTWQASRRLFLILDDFQLIKQNVLLEQVRRFIDFAPGLLRVICISRTDPPIRIAQLLARDQMLRLGAESLCFDLDLTRRFVRLRRDDISDTDIARLHQYTGGWPAALQLSASSSRLMAGAGPLAGAVTDEALAAYLLEEVFSQLSPELQQFLMDVSLLPLFSEDIANQARGVDDASRQIDAMLEHSLLVQHYGSGQRWFRLHDLLADWLRSRARPNDRTRRIRLAAARVFEQAGLVIEAVELLVAEHCFEEAETLVPALLLSDDLAGHRELGERFPEEIRRQSPALLLHEALFCLLEGRFADTLTLAERSERLLADRTGPEVESLRFTALMLRCPSARFTGQPMVAQSAIDQLSQSLEAGRTRLRNWGLYILGVDAFMDADLGLARSILEPALAGALAESDSNCALRCLGVLIPVLVHMGQVTEAARCFGRTCERLSNLPPVRDQAALLAYLEGLLAIEQNQLAQARASLDEASRLGRERMTLLDQLYLAFECFRLGMISCSDPDWRAALDDVLELHQQMGGGAWTYNIPEPDALKALAALKQGDASALIRWAQAQANEPPCNGQSRFSRLHEQLLELAGQLVLGLPVSESLDELIREGTRGQNDLLLCHLRLMQVLLLWHRDGEPDRAAGTLAEVLVRYLSAGVYRPLLDADAGLEPILEHCVCTGQAAGLANEVLALRRGDVSLVAATPETGAAGSNNASPVLTEPLSQRERHVLRLLSEGLSNKVMGTQLGISVATVKSHLSNIYGKLDADNRVRAVARARVLGLLD